MTDYKKPICVKCEIEFRPERNGMRVIEMFQQPPQPHAIWMADLWRCPGCGMEIIKGFGERALSRHFDLDFESILEETKKWGAYLYCYERKRDES